MTAESAPPSTAPAPRLADLEEALVEGLGEHLPGLEILDRGFVLSGGAEARALRADWVGVDACGRLVLISLVEGQSDEAVFAGLESVSLLRSNRALLARRWRSTRVSAAAPGLVALVAEAFSGRVLRSLSAVAPAELRMFEMRELSGAEGVRSALVPVGIEGSSARGADVGQACRTEFVDLVPAESRALAELCLAEIDRIDADLERRTSFDVVGWRYGRRDLCCLAWTGERLLGVVGSTDAAIPLRQTSDVHAFVDRVVGEHLRRLSSADGEPAERRREVPGAEESWGLAGNSGVLLSAEELAAFRD